MTVYHIGDLHHGHRNILKYRTNFSSIEEHDSTIVENINSTITKRDILYLHGDCYFTLESLDLLRQLRYCLQKIWILGNHDLSNNKDMNVLKTVLNEGLVDKVVGLHKHKGVWMSHAPVHSDELRGGFCCHGHVHSQTIDDYRYANVSCENVNYKPVDSQVLRECFKEQVVFRGDML